MALPYLHARNFFKTPHILFLYIAAAAHNARLHFCVARTQKTIQQDLCGNGADISL
jgi:hypothetical protein